MSARITINIGFYFEKDHYAQLQGYIPRQQALDIPELKILERQTYLPPDTHKTIEILKGSKNVKSQSKKESQQEMDDDQDDNIQDNEDIEDINLPNENQMEIEEDGQVEIDPQQQIQVDRALEELQKDNYDSDELSDDQEQIDMSDLSNGSPLKGFNNTKTKRQKGETRDLIQLPDRRPRKDKKLDEATEIIRRQQKQRKRKQYLKKQVQAQQKATLQKILNQTGRKLRLRQQKQMKEYNEREHKVFKSLGSMPKIITIQTQRGEEIYLSNSKLFPDFMTRTHDIKMKQLCTNCGNMSKYKMKEGDKYACSLPCYKLIHAS